MRTAAIPDDFLVVAPGKSLQALARHYGVGSSTVLRWRQRTGVAPAPRNAGRPFKAVPMPDGFATSAPTMTMKQLRAHYGRSAQTINRWCAEAGVEPRKTRLAWSGPKPLAIARIARCDVSVAGQAAEYLRRFGPVYRCNDTGRPNQGGRFWNRGGYILTDADLIARAERLGWDADAWRRVAA